MPVTVFLYLGYISANWTGSVANVNSLATTVTMSAPQTVTANFLAAAQPVRPAANMVFTAWNDGGEASHLISISGPETLIAVFKTQYGLDIRRPEYRL